MIITLLELLNRINRNLASVPIREDVIESWRTGMGIVGPEGPPGDIVWLGAWSAATLYLVDDAVQHNGSSYVAITDHINSAPPSANWDLLAAKGDTGTTGAQGPAGDAGPPGAEGPQGPQGNPGPNTISGSTTTAFSGLLKGTGTVVAVASAPADYVADSDSRLSDARTPTAHAASHGPAQPDALKLDDLAAPDDNTDLNASTLAHGLMQKYPGGTTNFLRADGVFAAPIASVAYSAFTKDLGAARRSGTFDITGLAGLTADQMVHLFQTAAPITSKGNARDEPEMDLISLTGYVVNATTIRVYWSAEGVVVGTYAFAYLVSA